ncbi:mitogen-activated protein kinase kinase kinase 1-like isoform X1 [Tripterygium wilfordii]|nr:mitogen-activated protein kinase kinase kinase 1-like isoform X1 [Tripterygium wilfordii]XP_038681846.1 mitogen-activated protein kinase kinase kinase 1-like isoform X1 [Tripterygium wilfordii]XP_038681848.1 mitogen-activated protein kinase kinase kinase 1-like isoform X1 [Tripterygium wilfordii]
MMEANKHKKRLVPRLDRRNAVKNIEYEPSSSSSSSSLDHLSPKLRTRSLELDSKTSFRVNGIDGEFDLICRSLGFSGPEDFAIPTSVWEAMKERSSSDIGFRLQDKVDDFVEPDGLSDEFKARLVVGGNFETEIEDSELRNPSNLANFVVNRALAKLKSDSKLAKLESRVGNGGDAGPSELVGMLNSATVGTSVAGGGRIRGVRPRALAPPPVKLPPVIDTVSSTWDIMRSFAPDVDDNLNSPAPAGDASSSDEEEKEVEKNEAGDDIIVEAVKEELNGVRIKEDDVLSEPCATSNDGGGDVPSEIMEPGYIISPDGKLRRSISSWQKGELLGSGSFGTVFEGYTDYGFFFAVKEVSLLDEGSQGRQSILQLQQEISLLKQFKHENIVRYLGTDKDETKLYIFLELITKGSLAKLYHKYHLKDSQVSVYTKQILNGLKYLHERNVVHRDIKCANILVHANGSVKLADFGLAKATKLNDVKSSKGTALWMAPEVVNLKNHGYGLAADIWSLGCTVLEMLTGQPPYSHLEGMQALFRIGRGILPPVPTSLSGDAQDFIFKCLQVDPNDRPTAAQLLDHPFVNRLFQTPSGAASPHSNGLHEDF